MSTKRNLKSFTIKTMIVAFTFIVIMLFISVGTSLFIDRPEEISKKRVVIQKDNSNQDLCRGGSLLDYAVSLSEFDFILIDKIRSLDINGDKNITTEEVATTLGKHSRLVLGGLGRDEFNQFIVSESTEVLNFVFSSFDRDKNGEITFLELESCLY